MCRQSKELTTNKGRYKLMKKRWTKITAMITVTSLMLSSLAGCGSTEAVENKQSDNTTAKATTEATSTVEAQETTMEDTSITYPMENAGSFTYGLTLDTAWSDRYDSYDQLPFGKALEEQTGFDMEMVHVADKTAMNLLLASGELPDAITYNFASNYTGGNAKALKDGLIYPMTEE